MFSQTIPHQKTRSGPHLYTTHIPRAELVELTGKNVFESTA